MSGNFGQIAQYAAKGAEQFVSRIGIRRGMKVLDVACGTGNLSIPAARLSEVVDGLRESHKGGIRYPIPTYTHFEPRMPAKYRDLRKMFDDERET